MDPERPKTLKEIVLQDARQQKPPHNPAADKRQAIQSAMRLIGEMTGQMMASDSVAGAAEQSDPFDHDSFGASEMLGGPEPQGDAEATGIESNDSEQLDDDPFSVAPWTEAFPARSGHDAERGSVIEANDWATPRIGSYDFLGGHLDLESIVRSRDENGDSLPTALADNSRNGMDSVSALIRRVRDYFEAKQDDASQDKSPDDFNSHGSTDLEHLAARDLVYRRDEDEPGEIQQLPYLPGKSSESPIQLLEERRNQPDRTFNPAPNSGAAPLTNPMTSPTDDGGPPLARPVVMLNLAEDQKRQIIDETVASVSKHDAKLLSEIAESKVDDAFWHYNCQLRAIG